MLFVCLSVYDVCVCVLLCSASFDLPDKLPDDLPDKLPDDLPDKLPDDLPDKLPDDLPDKLTIYVDEQY